MFKSFSRRGSGRGAGETNSGLASKDEQNTRRRFAGGQSTHNEINSLHEKIAALTLENMTMKKELAELSTALNRERQGHRIRNGAVSPPPQNDGEGEGTPENFISPVTSTATPIAKNTLTQTEKICKRHEMLSELQTKIKESPKAALTYTFVKRLLIEKFSREVFDEYKDEVQFLLSQATHDENAQRQSEIAMAASPKLKGTSNLEKLEDSGDNYTGGNEQNVHLLADENELWAWGQVFDETSDQANVSLRPRPHNLNLNIVQVACSWQVTSCYYLTSKGDIYHKDNGNSSSTATGGDDDQKPKILRTLALERALTRGASRIVKMACGSHHILALTGDGKVYSWGSGSEGSLGHGAYQDESVPRKCEALLDVVVTQIAAGSHHSMFLTADNTLFSCGDGSDGRLGLGDLDSRTAPTKIDLRVGAILRIACGWDFSALVAIEGEKAKKGNMFTSLFSGVGGIVAVSSPKRLSIDESVPGDIDGVGDLAAAQKGSFRAPWRRSAKNTSFLHGTTVLMWGNGRTGQCGTGRIENQLIPTTVKALDGKAVIDVACGHVHVVALCATGAVFTWGGGESGQLGTASIFEPTPQEVNRRDLGQDDTVKVIACGAFHTVCGTANGRVYSWGSNSVGALGLGHKIQKGTPSPVLFPKSIPDMEDGSERLDENSERLVPMISGDMQIYCAFNTTFVLCKKEEQHRASSMSKLLDAQDKQVPDSRGDKSSTKRDRKLRERWQHEIIPQWHLVSNEKWVLQLCRQGIPFQMREFVWPRIIGNAVKITPRMYSITLNHAKRLNANKDASASLSSVSSEDITNTDTAENSSLGLIDTDLARTFPGLDLFGGGGPWSTPLRECLEAFALHRPDLGYVQGMSYMAAMLLLNISDQYLTFQCLVNLMVKEHLFVFYLLDFGLIGQYLNIFDVAFQSASPNLFVHFQELEITSDMYLFPWIQTVFLKYLDLSVASRVWDNFLIEGVSFLFRTGLAILTLLTDYLIHAQMEEVMPMLQKKGMKEKELWHTLLSEDKLFKVIEKTSLTLTLKRRLEQLNADVYKFMDQ
jgi:alpha-tubulin suppressor-like RCC1 family protein